MKNSAEPSRRLTAQEASEMAAGKAQRAMAKRLEKISLGEKVTEQ